MSGPADEQPTCGHRAPATGRPACKRRAVYRVSRRRETRDTCRVHLAATVDALAQGDSSLMLTITYVPAGEPNR